MATANEIILVNLKSLLERIKEQLKDLNEGKSDPPEDVVDWLRHLLEQIEEIGKMLSKIKEEYKETLTKKRDLDMDHLEQVED